MVNYNLEELIKWIETNQFEWAKSFSYEGKYLGAGESEPISFSEWVKKHQPTWTNLKKRTWIRARIHWPSGHDWTEEDEESLCDHLEAVKKAIKAFEREREREQIPRREGIIW